MCIFYLLESDQLTIHVPCSAHSNHGQSEQEGRKWYREVHPPMLALRTWLLSVTQEEGDDKRNKETSKSPLSLNRSHLKLIWKTWPWLTLWVLLSNPWSISPNSVLFRWLSGRKHLAPSHMSDTNMQDLPSMANRYSSTQLGKKTKNKGYVIKYTHRELHTNVCIEICQGNGKYPIRPLDGAHEIYYDTWCHLVAKCCIFPFKSMKNIHPT